MAMELLSCQAVQGVYRQEVFSENRTTSHFQNTAPIPINNRTADIYGGLFCFWNKIARKVLKLMYHCGTLASVGAGPLVLFPYASSPSGCSQDDTSVISI